MFFCLFLKFILSFFVFYNIIPFIYIYHVLGNGVVPGVFEDSLNLCTDLSNPQKTSGTTPFLEKENDDSPTLLQNFILIIIIR